MCFTDLGKILFIIKLLVFLLYAGFFIFFIFYFFSGSCARSEMTSVLHLNDIIILIYLNSYILLSEPVNPHIIQGVNLTILIKK